MTLHFSSVSSTPGAVVPSLPLQKVSRGLAPCQVRAYAYEKRCHDTLG
jgi:hypothetical protein